MSRIKRSRCQDNAKPMSRRMRSRCRYKGEANVNKTITGSPLHAQTNMQNGSTHIDARWETRMQIFSHQSLHWLLGFLLVLYRNIVLIIKRASRSNVRPCCSKMLFIYIYIYIYIIYIYIYIYIHAKLTFWGSVLERFLDRFWRGFWIDFGEVFGEVLERFWRGF